MTNSLVPRLSVYSAQARPRAPLSVRASRWLVPALRRSLDVSATAVGLLAIAPLLALTALLVRLDSRGPILFAQERVGLRTNASATLADGVLTIELPPVSWTAVALA